jgi:rare lipoprotein A
LRISVFAASAFLLAVGTALPAAAGGDQCGIASWYGPGFHGRTAANGETYNQDALTAAHPTLPFGTVVEVTRTDASGGSVRVRITDRGPYVGQRIIDLSRAAARALDMVDAGIVPVRVTIVSGTASLPGGCA